jgi:hypothetical protein
MTRIHPRRSIATAVVLAAALLFGGAFVPALAEEAGSASFSEAQLQSFAQAQNAVDAIREKYQEQLRSADPAELGFIQQQMDQEMVDVVQRSGLDVATYNEIVYAAQADPEVARKIEEMR